MKINELKTVETLNQQSNKEYTLTLKYINTYSNIVEMPHTEIQTYSKGMISK